MTERRAELERRLAYIERELKRGQHEYPGRDGMLREERNRIRKELES
jgi:hypothetical protein